MTIRTQAPFYGKRFAGDTSNMVVHDLLYEREVTTISKCNIEEIDTNHIKTFSPDNLNQAKEEGFRPCPVCHLDEQ